MNNFDDEALPTLMVRYFPPSYIDGEVHGCAIFCKDRKNHGGGVVLAVDHSLSASLLPSPVLLLLHEVLTIRLNL